MKVTININTHGNPVPEVHGDWIDLCTAEEVVMKAGEYRLISLGVSMELPTGYYAQVLPRSSTPKNWGIVMANGMGIIDNAYNGDNDIWGFPALAFRDTTIPKGARIAQFTLVETPDPIYFREVNYLWNENRGGFGSSGKFARKKAEHESD